MRLKADITLLSVSIVWGFAFVAQYFAADYNATYLFNGLGFLIAAVALFPLVPKKIAIPREQWFWMLAAGFILFVASALQQVGLEYTKVANAGFLTSLYTVFTPFGLFFLFREKPDKFDITAVLLAAIGAYLLSTKGIGFEPQAGDLLEIIGAVFWALHIVVLGKFATKFEPLSFSAGQFFFAAITNLSAGLFLENTSVVFAPIFIGAVLFRAIFSITIGYTLQVWGQRHTPPTDAALILSLESVFAAIAGWLILKDVLLPIQILGCGIIFSAVVLTQVKNLFESKNTLQTS